MSSNISFALLHTKKTTMLLLFFRVECECCLVLYMCIYLFFQSISLPHLMYSRIYLGNKNLPFLISDLAFLYSYFLSQFIVYLPFLFWGIIIGFCNYNSLHFRTSTISVHKDLSWYRFHLSLIIVVKWSNKDTYG